MAVSAAGQSTLILMERNQRMIMCAPGGKDDSST